MVNPGDGALKMGRPWILVCGSVCVAWWIRFLVPFSFPRWLTLVHASFFRSSNVKKFHSAEVWQVFKKVMLSLTIISGSLHLYVLFSCISSYYARNFRSEYCTLSLSQKSPALLGYYGQVWFWQLVICFLKV
uniref:Uncharacterized protein n=1 Tax=Rhipicephalus zambeziensis TaxID=60191 RepID=A0A224Y7F9_9ACAR